MTTMAESETDRWERLARGRQIQRLPKRFYKEAAISQVREILLDGRAVKTPLKKPLALPTMPLAEAVAAEWRAQVGVIDPHSMPLTKLANTAIDRVPAERSAIVVELVSYAGNDLVCYRADHPTELAARQSASWDPIVAWADRSLGVAFLTTAGVTHRPQSPSALSAFKSAIDAIDDFRLVGLHAMATLSGSALLALTVATSETPAEDAWAAATVDERWQNEVWGEDHEAAQRRKAQAGEFIAAARFVNLACA
jgi:chaperone required for assembly of F1-ATPase